MKDKTTENRFLHAIKPDRENLPDIKDNYKVIISEYFNNGFNGAKALRDINKTNTGNEGRLFKQIFDRPEVQTYIKTLQREVQRRANISQTQIVNELINIGFADNTAFIGLKPEEIKQLPPEIKRLIVSFDHKTIKYTNRDGEPVEEEYIKLKFADKIKAIDMLNKHLGTYNADNKQKSTQININNLDSLTINNLLQAINLDKPH